MDIPSIRQANLILLAQAYPTRVAFCEAAQLRPDQLNHLIAGSKNIGNKLAARIETNLKLTSGSLSHTADAQIGQSLLDNDPRRELLRALNSAALTQEDALALLHIVKKISDTRIR